MKVLQEWGKQMNLLQAWLSYVSPNFPGKLLSVCVPWDHICCLPGTARNPGLMRWRQPWVQALTPALCTSLTPLLTSFFELVLLFVFEPDKISTPGKTFVAERVANWCVVLLHLYCLEDKAAGEEVVGWTQTWRALAIDWSKIEMRAV